MSWRMKSLRTKTTMKGTYRDICWSIISTIFNDDNGTVNYMEWSAGLRGSGVADTYERCKECIETKIDMSLQFERSRNG